MEIVIIAVLTVVKWLVYTGLLWVMIKLQKLQYNVAGLFASSLLATLIQFIPVVGGYAAWAVLVLCLWKVTRSDIVPDVLFTVAVAGAIMFCLNLWAFAALMGELRPNAELRLAAGPPTQEDDLQDEEAPPQAVQPSALPPAPAKPMSAPAATAVKQALVTAATNAIALVRPRTASPAQAMPALALKGVMLDSAQPSAMIMTGGKYYTIQPGDTLSVPLAQGQARVHCTAITASAVSLTLNDTDEITLRVH
jgi:hypothetical protein